tara:strand:- start:3296 stop:3751 length:456 start_codon:yes stop_codon:yes gene_type:complete
MSFQKAHQISNELGEVVVTSSEFLLNQADGTTTACNFPAPFKTYRVLEVGFVVTNNVASNESTFEFGTVAGSDEFVEVTSAITIAADSKGTKFSTDTGAFSFRASAGAIDTSGVPVLENGETLQVQMPTNGTAACGVVFFARLAPNIEYKD